MDVNLPGNERMMRWFAHEHLADPLRSISARFHALALEVCNGVDPGPERTVCLRKLLEAKDAAVRAKMVAGG